MRNNLKRVLILSLPLLCKYIFLLCFIEWSLFNHEDILEDLFFLIIMLLLLNSSLIKKQYVTDFFCFVYVLYVILETTSYMAVSSNFSSSFMYLLLESNTHELSEFITSYITIPIVLFIIVNCILFFVIRKNRLKTSNKYYPLFGVMGVIGIVFLLKLTGLIESNAYHNIVRGTYGYIDLQNNFKVNSEIEKEDINVISDNEVLVIVLGESTARKHMQLYGYNRGNTPFLSAIKDSLFVYNNVISTDVFTLKVVPKMLTSLDVNSNNTEATNIVELFNASGYKTFWLSNQRPISYHDNAISKIASASSMFKFYNHLDDVYTHVLDEVVFLDYNKILNQPGKKAIFIKLIGTHFNYSKRYPKGFNKFISKDNLSKEKTIVNQYDNAILYNDFIVHSLIENLKKANKKSALLYVSDHGENVYDNGTDFFGRSEENFTKSMFEIPFFLWTSKDFTFPNDFEYVPNRKFMADHTYESIGHISGIKYKNIDVSRSIFSNSYKPRKRTVLDNTLDFDNYFLKEDE